MYQFTRSFLCPIVGPTAGCFPSGGETPAQTHLQLPLLFQLHPADSGSTLMVRASGPMQFPHGSKTPHHIKGHLDASKEIQRNVVLPRFILAWESKTNTL